MNYTLKAVLSIGAGVGGAVLVIAGAGAAWDLVGGVVVTAALLVFIRAIMNLVSETGDRRDHVARNR